MKLTIEQVKRIKEKYEGYQVFDCENIVGDPISIDDEMPFVKVCHEYEYIELYDQRNSDIENFEEFFIWGEPILKEEEDD